MIVTVNGEERELEARPDLSRLVAQWTRRDDELPGVAVALNGELVRRSEWGQVELRDGDELEIVEAVSGG